MRADRLISILLLLQANEQMTARALASRLEVSERTIHRDMEALSAAGIPVVAERGSSGGWRLLDKYRTDLTGLTQAELQSLFLTKPPRLLADLGLRQAAEGALVKLFAALPSLYRHNVEFFRQRIHIDGMSWARSQESLTFLPVVQEALWQERQIILTYQRSDESTSERAVSPLGLVAKSNTWYLVARIEDGELRTYRISRIKHATISTLTAVRPDSFDLAAYWEQSTTEFRQNLPRYPVAVRVSPDIMPRFLYSGRYARVQQVHRDDPDERGWIRVDLLCEVDWEAAELMLSFGANVEILEPVDLRNRVMEMARDVLAFYQVSEDKHLPVS